MTTYRFDTILDPGAALLADVAALFEHCFGVDPSPSLQARLIGITA